MHLLPGAARNSTTSQGVILRTKPSDIGAHMLRCSPLREYVIFTTYLAKSKAAMQDSRLARPRAESIHLTHKEVAPDTQTSKDPNMEPRNRFNREPQSLEAWETWVDKLIVDAQERGEFDDLPGHGKPLHIAESPFAGGLDVGFGILKNAGIAPYWVEVEKELRTASSYLDEILSQAVVLSSQLADAHNAPITEVEPESEGHRRAWWRLRRDGASMHTRTAPRPDARSRELAGLRRRYLEQADVVDRLIAQYNAAIPRDLWHLERPRLTPDAAGETFDRLATPCATESPGSNAGS
jgi:hypothetical protein